MMKPFHFCLAALIFLSATLAQARHHENIVEEATEATDAACEEVIRAISGKSLFADYRRFLTTYRYTPTKREFADFMKTTEGMLEDALAEETLEDLADLEKAARLRYATSRVFEKVIPRELFSPARRQAMLTAAEKRTRILVTSAGPGRLADEAFQGLLDLCKEKDAELFVIPINMRTEGLDPRLFNTPGVHIVTHDFQFGDVTVYSTAIPGHRRNPHTNMETQGNRMEVQIVGHPKLIDRQVASLHNDWAPHRLMSTGTITFPFQEGIVQGLLQKVAQGEEMIGAVLLEKHLGNPILKHLGASPGMHARHIEYRPGHGFCDVGTRYDGGKIKKERPLGLVLGDVHVGQTDPALIEALVQQILTLNPQYIVLHDLFDGNSISHHEFNNFMSRMDKARAGKLSLKNEIHRVVTFVNALMARVPHTKIIVVASNHDYWLKRRLEDAQKVMADLANAEFSIELWEQHRKQPHVPPLLHAMKTFHIDHPEKLLFLKHGESFEFGGLLDARLQGHEYQVGQHGHAGANGAKGSLPSLMRALYGSISGDSHNADRINNTVKAGTITKYRVGYNKEGFSSWAQALTLAYGDGTKQTLRFQNGSFYTAEAKLEIPKDFFPPGFPTIVPTTSDGREFRN